METGEIFRMTICLRRGLLETCLIVLPFVNVTKAQSAGELFGSREPIICPSTVQPEKGPITPEIARRYVICRKEHKDDRNISLIGEIHIEVGKGVPFKSVAAGLLAQDADPDGMLYALRGSFTAYRCSKIVAMNAGKNCELSIIPRAKGECYRTTFGGAWHCDFGRVPEDFNPGGNLPKRSVPPPQRPPD